MENLRNPCKKCCIDIMCNSICPRRIYYTVFLYKTEKFCEKTNMGLGWAWLFIIGVRWATKITTPAPEQDIFPILIISNMIIYAWIGLYLKIKAFNKNDKRFNLSYHDIDEMNKKMNEENLKNTERR